MISCRDHQTAMSTHDPCVNYTLAFMHVCLVLALRGSIARRYEISERHFVLTLVLMLNNRRNNFIMTNNHLSNVNQAQIWRYVNAQYCLSLGYATCDRERRSDTFSYLLYVFFNLKREAKTTKRVPFRNAAYFNVAERSRLPLTVLNCA